MIVYVSTIVATWIAATVAVLVECNPFHRWWQLYPDPGPCVQANKWLITYEVGNMVTDAMLLALPFPLLFMAKVPWEKRIRLFALFSLGFFLLAICLVRMVQGLRQAHFQLSRTMWASIEMLFATIVACSPSIYCHLRRSLGGSSTTNSASTTLRGSRPSGASSTQYGIGRDSFGSETRKYRFPGSIGGSPASSFMSGPRTRYSSIFSNYRNSERRKSSRNMSVVSRHSIMSRNLSVSSRNMSFSSRHSGAGRSNRMGSYAGSHLDITTLDGEIPGLGCFGGHERGSVSATVWTHSGLMEEGRGGGEKEKEDKEKFYVIDEEEGKDLEGIMVETTWSQVSEVDTECRQGVSGTIPPPSRTITEEEEPEASP
ncbi:hypothetical protein TWF281_011639 [Arthrobotrys megalospora]